MIREVHMGDAPFALHGSRPTYFTFGRLRLVFDFDLAYMNMKKLGGYSDSVSRHVLARSIYIVITISYYY